MPTALINGHEHYWEDTGSGDPIVMLHGAAGSGKSFVPQVKDLSADFRVIVPDMRGMGRSAHVTSLEPASAWVDDLVGLLDHLELQRVHIYGRSLGARVALRAAIDHPSRCRSIMLDAPIVANDPAGNAALNQRYGNLTEEAKQAHRDNHGDDWEQVVKNYASIRNDKQVQQHYNLRDLCADCNVPALIVRGDIDEPIHPLAHAFEIHQKLPDSRLAIVPNFQSRAIANQVPPDVMGQLVRGFIAALETATR